MAWHADFIDFWLAESNILTWHNRVGSSVTTDCKTRFLWGGYMIYAGIMCLMGFQTNTCLWWILILKSFAMLTRIRDASYRTFFFRKLSITRPILYNPLTFDLPTLCRADWMQQLFLLNYGTCWKISINVWWTWSLLKKSIYWWAGQRSMCSYCLQCALDLVVLYFLYISPHLALLHFTSLSSIVHCAKVSLTLQPTLNFNVSYLSLVNKVYTTPLSH